MSSTQVTEEEEHAVISCAVDWKLEHYSAGCVKDSHAYHRLGWIHPDDEVL